MNYNEGAEWSEKGQEKRNIMGNSDLTDFIVNHTNRRAYEIAKNIIGNEDEKIGNPFWIVADTGCGKSHLVSIIAESYKSRGKKVKTVSGDAFLKNFIWILKVSDTKEEAVEKTIGLNGYVTDLLMIEELDYCLSGKCASQIFFIETILYLIRRFGTRVLLTSKRMEKSFYLLIKQECPNLAAVFMGNSDFSLRKRIVRAKFAAYGLECDNAVIEIIAENTRNGAQIRGIVEQVRWYKELDSTENVSKDMVENILKIKGY